MAVALSALRVQADFDASKYVQGAAQKEAADRRMVASAGQLGTATDQTSRSLDASGQSLARYAQSSAGADQAQQRRLSALRVQAAPDQLLAQPVAFGDQLDAFGGASVAAGAGGLAAGLGSLGRIAGLAAGGSVIAALGAGILLLAARADEAEGHVAGFNRTLTALGTGGLDTAKDLQSVVVRLRDSGSAAADAYKAVQIVAANPRVPQSLAGGIITGARDVAAAFPLGGDVVANTQRLTQALGSGFEAIRQLDAEWNFLTVDESAQIRVMQQHGDLLGAQKLAVDALALSYGGNFKNSLTAWQQIVINLTGAWNGFLDRLTQTQAFQTARQAVIDFTKNVADEVSGDAIPNAISPPAPAPGEPPPPPFASRVRGLLPDWAWGALGGGAAGFVAGGPVGAVIGAGIGLGAGVALPWLTQSGGLIGPQSAAQTLQGTGLAAGGALALPAPAPGAAAISETAAVTAAAVAPVVTAVEDAFRGPAGSSSRLSGLVGATAQAEAQLPAAQQPAAVPEAAAGPLPEEGAPADTVIPPESGLAVAPISRARPLSGAEVNWQAIADALQRARDAHDQQLVDLLSKFAAGILAGSKNYELFQGINPFIGDRVIPFGLNADKFQQQDLGIYAGANPPETNADTVLGPPRGTPISPLRVNPDLLDLPLGDGSFFGFRKTGFFGAPEEPSASAVLPPKEAAPDAIGSAVTAITGVIDKGFAAGADALKGAGSAIGDAAKAVLPPAPDTAAAEAEKQSREDNTAAIKALTGQLVRTGNLVPGGALALPSGPSGLSANGAIAQKQIGDYAIGSLGFTPGQAAALIGQARQESSFNPASGLGTAHQGMFRWDAERWGQLQAWAQLNGLDPLDYRVQLQFAKQEIQTRAPEFFTASSLADQTSILTRKFEVPGNYGWEIPQRLGFAQQALSSFGAADAGLADLQASAAAGFAKPAPSLPATSLDRANELNALVKALDQALTPNAPIGPALNAVAAGNNNLDEDRVKTILEAQGLSASRTAGSLGLGGELSGADLKTLTALTEAYARQDEVLKKTGTDSAEYQAAQTSVAAVDTSALAGKAALIAKALAVDEAIERQNIAADNAHTVTGVQIEDSQKLAAAWGESEVAALRQAAANQASTKAAAEGGDEDRIRADLLQKSAQDAVEASAKQAGSLDIVIGRQRDLATAAEQGAAKLHAAELQGAASTATHDALAKATAFYEDALKSQDAEEIKSAAALARTALAANDKALALEKARAGAQQDLALASQLNGLKDQSEVTQLQTSLTLQGATTAQIAAQTTLLQERQKLDAQDLEAQPALKQAVLDRVAAQGILNERLEEAKAAQQAWNDAINKAANQVDQTLTSAITNALDGQKVAAWGATFRKVIAQIIADIANLTFIRPAIGAATSLLGLNPNTTGGVGFGGGGNFPGFGGAGAGSSLSQPLAITVQGVASGGAIIGATQGGTAFQGTNQLQVQTSAPAIVVDNATGAAAGGTAAAATTAAPISGETTALSAAGAPSEFLIPGTETPISGATFQTAAPIVAEAAAATALTAPGAPAAQPALTVTAPAGSGTLSLGNISSVLGLAKNLGGGFFGQPGLLPDWLSSSGSGTGGGLFGNVGNFFSSLNPFASSAAPIGGIAGAPFSSTIAGPSIPSDLLGGVTPVNPGLFGTTATFGSVLSGAGAGFGAGTLLNSILGGNALTGTVGSGAGSIAGAVIGSIVPGIGTLIGGIVGGLGGSLAGLFGNSKPSNNASGENVNLATGAISGYQSGGVAANDQTATQIGTALSQFAISIQKLTDTSGNPIGSTAGTINVQAGSRDGIRASYSGPLGSFTSGQYADAQSAVNDLELKIAQNLQGVSGTLKVVLANLTDPSQIQAAVQFAGAYDDLTQAAANAFSSISADTKTIGPFQAALEQINSTFAGLTAQANQYGLPVGPIEQAQAAATQRLTQDFGQSLDAALNAAETGGSDFVTQLQAVHQAFVQNTNDAAALGLGGDTATQQKIGGIETAQAGTILAGLSTDQLAAVITALGGSAPEIAQMAQSLLDTGDALPNAITQLMQGITDPVGLALEKEKALGDERVAAAEATGQSLVQIQQLNALDIEQIWNQATASLKSLSQDITGGSLSGLTPANQVVAANDNFQAELALVQAGNTNELGNLATAGQAVVTAAQGAYGNGPQTAQVRAQVLGAINSVLSSPPTAVTSAAGANAPLSTPVTGSALTAAPPAPNPTGPQISAAIGDILAGNASAGDYGTIDSAVTAGIISATAQPQFAGVIAAAGQWAANQAAGVTAGVPSPLTSALSNAVAGAATPSDWALINYAANAGIIDPTDPQYANVVQAARTIANANAAQLAQQPSLVSANATVTAGVTPFAAGTIGTPPGPILVGEVGPEWMQPAGGSWTQVGLSGPEIIDQPGGATILPFPQIPFPAFAGGTGSADPGGVIVELKALRDEVTLLRRASQGGQADAVREAVKANAHLGAINGKIAAGLPDPGRRAAGK